MKVVMASNNAHKIAELRAILSAYGLDVVSQREAGVHVEPEETGTTFEENSRIKAVAVMQACGLPAVADDSGLMVDALNGEPGVYSARYGGPDCISDSDRINYLLKKLENVPEGKRTAKFVSVITLVTPDGKELVAVLSKTYPDLKARVFGAMQRLPLPQWGVTPHPRGSQKQLHQHDGGKAGQAEKADDAGRGRGDGDIEPGQGRE